MDQVLGNEDTSNPPLFTEANSFKLLAFAQPLNSSRLMSELTPSPNDDASEMGSSFNSERKTKWKMATMQSEALVDLIVKKMELEKETREEKKVKEAKQRAKEEQHAERQEMCAEKLVNIMETLVKHLTQQ